MIGRPPSEIWQDSLEDGQRRVGRTVKVLAATGLLGGLHIAFGLLALVVTTGALATLMAIYPAHVFGLLIFGIGLVFAASRQEPSDGLGEPGLRIARAAMQRR